MADDDHVEVEEYDRVVGWRFERLVEAGYTLREATLLAYSDYVDLHQAVELARVCPPDVAIRILA